MKNYYVNVQQSGGPSPYPIEIVNGSGCTISTITGDTGGQFTIPEITINDGASFSASTPSPNVILVSGSTVDSISASGCNLTINISGGAAPSNSGVYVFESNTAVAASINDVAALNETPNSIVFLGEKGTTYMTTVGNRHGAAIKNFVGGTGGELWVWGLNISGSIGGSPNYQWTQIGVDSDWEMVVAGGNTTLAIKNGALYGTGLNTSGQLGDGTTTNKSVFTQIGVDTDWEFIETNGVTSIAIKGGDLYACGRNIDYMTGNGTTEAGNTTTWTLVNSAETWTYVSVGRFSCMAVTSTGKLYSWGNDINGVTGQGTFGPSDTTSPTQVGSDTDWVMCAVGNQTSYAIKTTGTLWGTGQAGGSVWGSNSSFNTFQQEGLGDTDWDYVDCASTNGVFVRKTNGTLWSSGLSPANMQYSNLNTLTQIGTDTNWERNYRMHTSGFNGENCFIKS
jgi:hypothetical protein